MMPTIIINGVNCYYHDGTDEPQGIGTSTEWYDYQISIGGRWDVKPITVVKTKNRGPVMNRGKGKHRRNYDQ